MVLQSNLLIPRILSINNKQHHDTKLYIFWEYGESWQHEHLQCQHLIPALNAWVNTQQQTWLPPSFLGIDAWMTSQLNIALIRKLCSMDVLGLYFWHVIHGYLYNQALADVRSNCAVIKCLYWTGVDFWYFSILSFRQSKKKKDWPVKFLSAPLVYWPLQAA